MSLDINAIHYGQKVKFLDKNGNDYQLEKYRQWGLEKDSVYTISGFRVHSWDTEIWLSEFGECRFNSVCFIEAD